MRALLTGFLLLLTSPLWAQNSEHWLPYPANLPVFDYSGDKLEHAWPQLTQGTQQDWPSAEFFVRMAKKYPQLHEYMLEQARNPDAHPALKALLAGDTTPLAQAVQQVWRLHYAGKFKESYAEGMKLGVAGAVPAIYSKLMYGTFMVQDPQEKLAIFRDAADESQALLPMTPGYDFAEFGLLYARVRILERLNTTAALATGFLGSTQKSLKEFTVRNPQVSLYPTTLGGIQAGVVERVGSMIGRITYNATEGKTIEHFEEALKIEDNLPVIYNEYIVALNRINPKKHHDRIQKLSAQCHQLQPFSAEEALNQSLCGGAYQQQQVVSID